MELITLTRNNQKTPQDKLYAGLLPDRNFQFFIPGGVHFSALAFQFGTFFVLSLLFPSVYAILHIVAKPTKIRSIGLAADSRR